MSPRIHPRAGQLPAPNERVDLEKLRAAYYAGKPDPAIPSQRVSFGTSGHRGSAFHTSFNENHILAITQAICDYRKAQGIDGPLFLGADTHALSAPALESALETLAANSITTFIDASGGYTPTPAISHAILVHNKTRETGLADGIVITPSHNPPEDGGFKYNPPHGGPAGTDITRAIESAANNFLAENLSGVKRSRARDSIRKHDYIATYIADLETILDMEAIRSSDIRIGIDPLGGAAVNYWEPLIARYRLNAKIVNDKVDPQFAFMPLDWDGKIRMDCSSPYAMKNLLALKDDFDIAFGNDTDADRHGIVCPSGLMPPNDYLATAFHYLKTHRENWPRHTGIGKTIVSSAMIDRVAKDCAAPLHETPVGFKYFVEGLQTGRLGFAGEESAGASFLRRDGTVWTTDKDGLIAGLLAAEICARTGRNPAENYRALTTRLGQSHYARIDRPATPQIKSALSKMTPDQITLKNLAGDPISEIRNTAPGNNEAFGGIKVITAKGWFAARPSGTEDVYKIYAESFESEAHLAQIQQEAGSFIAATS